MSSKKNKRVKNRSGMRNVVSQSFTSRLSARTFQSHTSTANTVVITEFELLPANLGARFVGLADVFTHWRMTKMRAYAFIDSVGVYTPTQSVAVNCRHGLAYTPAPSDEYTAPNSTTTFVDFPSAVMGNERERLQINCNRRDLKGNFDWLYTNNETLNQRSAGVITGYILNNQAVVNNTTTQSIIIEFDCEFRGPIDPALQPLLKIQDRPGLLCRNDPSVGSYVYRTQYMSDDYDDYKDESESVSGKVKIPKQKSKGLVRP